MLRPILPVLMVACSLLQAQEDPLAAPPELRDFARKATATQTFTKGKLQHLLDAIFRSPEEGGLGMTYDNTRTRTVAEVWRDRKANCLSLTAFYVAACDSVGVRAQFAEALNTNRWRRVGSVIRFERHLVGLVPLPPMEDVVADFLPQLRRRMGVYRVAAIQPERVRSLFFANRAVECLEENSTMALEMAQASLKMDSSNSVGWNILGVVLKTQGDPVGAEKAFTTALQYGPKDSSAIGNLESLYREQGRLEEASRYRALGQEVRKKDPYFHAFLAEEAMGNGDLEEAQKRIKMALRLLPYESEFHLTQARIHIQMGKADVAVKDLEEAQRWSNPEERERYDSKLAAIREQQKKEKAGKGESD